MSTEKLYKLPNAQELAEIRSNKQLYHSNIFRMELEEVERANSIDFNALPIVTGFLNILIEKINAVPSRSFDEKDTLSKIFPYLKESFNVKENQVFDISSPVSVDIIGSVALKAQLKNLANIDIAVAMPASMFDTRDFVGYKYFDKRNAFVGHLYEHLDASVAALEEASKKKFLVSVQLEAWRGDLCKPVVSVVVRNAALPKSAPMFTVRVLPCLEDVEGSTVFPAHRLGADSMGARKVRMTSTDGDETASGFYNCLVAEDAAMLKIHREIQKLAQKTPAFPAALRLLKLWANARSLLDNRVVEGSLQLTGLSGFELALILQHVCTQSGASQQAMPVQLFKMALAWMAELAAPKDFYLTAPAAVEIGGCNLLFRAQLLAQELGSLARVSAHHVEVERNPFDLLFGSAALRAPWADGSVWLIPGEHLSAPVLSTIATLEPSVLTTLDEKALLSVSFGAPAPYLQLGVVTTLLKAGLKDRVSGLSARVLVKNPSKPWTKASPLKAKDRTVQPLLLLKAGIASSMARQLERGPAVGTPEADQFRKFWGGKAQMRRFRDGMVAEAVMWDAQTSPERTLEPVVEESSNRALRPAVVDIIHYLLQLHFPAVYGELDGPKPSAARIQLAPLACQSTPPADLLSVQMEFHEFAQKLKDLDDLPLPIKDVHAAGPAIRYTAVALPRASVLKGLRKHARTPHSYEQTLIDAGLVNDNEEEFPWGPQEAIIELVHAPNWPTEKSAVDALKTQILLRIASTLEAAGYAPPQVSRLGFMDVRYVQTVYRCRLVCPFELVGNAVAASNVEAPPSVRPHKAALTPLRENWWKPTVSNKIAAAILANPSLGAGIRLAKLWLAAHHFEGADWLIEMLATHAVMSRTRAANALLKSSRHAAVQTHEDTGHAFVLTDEPTTGQTAFLQLLELLSTHDWEVSPLWVSLDFDADAATHNQLAKNATTAQVEGVPEETALEALKAHREANLPVGVAPAWMSVACKYDPLALLCPMPVTSELKRLVATAKTSLANAKSLLFSPKAASVLGGDLLETGAQAWVEGLLHGGVESFGDCDVLLALSKKVSLGKKDRKEEFANLKLAAGGHFADVNNKEATNGILIAGQGVSTSDLPHAAAFAGWVSDVRRQLGASVQVAFNPLQRPAPQIVGLKFRPTSHGLAGLTAALSLPSLTIEREREDAAAFAGEEPAEVEAPKGKKKKTSAKEASSSAVQLSMVDIPAVVAQVVALGGPLVTNVELNL